MIFRGIEKVSLVDFPGHICATVFTSGCNMRCPYCYNKDLVLEARNLPSISEEEILEFLKKRYGLIDGVCITGGEPTLQPGLAGFIRKVAGLGLKVKLDTNGTSPTVLGDLLRDGLLDYVAMDIKAPLRRYREVTRSQTALNSIVESIRIIRQSGPDYEFRTTVAPGLIAGADLIEIGHWLRGSARYVLQQYVPGKTLDETLNRRPYPRRWLEDIASKLRPFFGTVEVRGCNRLP